MGLTGKPTAIEDGLEDIAAGVSDSDLVNPACGAYMLNNRHQSSPLEKFWRGAAEKPSGFRSG